MERIPTHLVHSFRQKCFKASFLQGKRGRPKKGDEKKQRKKKVRISTSNHHGCVLSINTTLSLFFNLGTFFCKTKMGPIIAFNETTVEDPNILYLINGTVCPGPKYLIFDI